MVKRKKQKSQAASMPGSLSLESVLVSADIDGEIAQQLNRLSRKNRTAKLKALAALSQLIKQKPAKETIKMMHQWAFIYRKLLLDYNREVRLAVHGTMTDIVIALGQDLNPYIKTLIGPWWFSQFDLEHQVSQAAKSSFETAFPASEERLLALTSCSTEILTYIEEKLKLTSQSSSDVAFAAEELEQMHQQVLSSSLRALEALLDVFPFQNSAKSTRSDLVELMPAVEKLCTCHNYFTGFFKSQSPIVRMAAYSVVKSCTKLSTSHAFDKGALVKVVFPAMLGSFQEKNPACHSSMWEALLLFMKTFPESWNTVNVPKSILNPLLDFLKNGCFGSQQVSYPALINFLNMLPPQNSITEDTFFLEFFRNLWAGRKLACSSDATDRLAFFSAIKDCFFWAFTNASRYCDGADALCRFKGLLVDEILVGLLWHEYQIVSSAYNPSLSNNEIQPTHATDYEENIGECIIKILSRLPSDLFQADCSEKLRLEIEKHSQNVHWIVRFLLLLNRHAVQKGETWPFDLVRPTLKSFQDFDSPDTVELLEVAASIFGPRKILCEIVCSSDLGNVDISCASLNDIVIPWCLQDHSDIKLDLLLGALLDNEERSFLKEWDAVINFLVDLVTANIESSVDDDKDKLSVFASLMKKAREINRRQTTKPVVVKYQYHVLVLMKKAWGMTMRENIKWHHDCLDCVAVYLVRASPPYGKSDAQFISAVLGGAIEDDKSFLSPCTQIVILEEVCRKLLLFMMDSNYVWVSDLCSLLVNKTSYSDRGNEESCCENNSSDMASFALDILCGSIFSLKNIEDGNEELIEGIVAAIFIIDWEYNLITMWEDDHNDEQLEKVNSRFASGRAAHALHCRVSEQLLKGFDANRRKSLGAKLIESAKRAVFIDSDVFLSDEYISTCCKWILDVFRVLCVDRLDQQQLLDQLLSKNERWPTWITADSVATRTENVHPHGIKNANFMAVIDKLIPKLGFDELVARPWLVAEFLCTWKWTGGSAFGSFLPSFVGYLNDKDDSSEYFYHIIAMLFDGAIAHRGVDSCNPGLNHLFWLPSFEEIGTVEEPFLRALLSLLSTLFREKIWGEENALSLFEQLVNELHVGATDVNLNFLSILPFVMNILVGTQFLDEHACFQSATVKWLERVVSFPPLNEWETGNDMEDWFKLIIACFPIKVTEGMRRKDDNKLEQSLVLLPELLQNQNVAISINGMKPPSSVQMRLLSKLMVISVAYCGVLLDEDEWIFILSYSRDWIDSAVKIMKEIAEMVNNESMNESVVDTAALSSKLKDNVVNDCLTIALNAVVVFSLPCKLGADMEENPSEANSFVIERTEMFGTDEVLEKYLCLFFYTAAAESLADSNDRHEETSSIITSFRFDHRHLWELVGSFVDKTTTRVRERAVKSMEELGLNKDPIASLYALLFSCKPLPPMQCAALELLTTVPLVRSASTFDIGGTVFGLREEIFCILRRSSEVSKMDLLALERVNVFVVWGLVLTFLTSQSTNSSVIARQRAIQGVAGLTDFVVILDCLFQHIPVERCFGTSSTKKYRKLGNAVSIAGNAAKRAIKEGSASFAIKSLWPVAGHDSMASLSGAVFGLMLCNFPSYVRQWWSDVRDSLLSASYELFIKSWCSKELVSYESSHMKECGLEDGNLSISKATTSATNKEVMAIYTKDEAAMELIIRFPQTSYPLKPADFYYGDGNLGIDTQKRYEWLNSLKSFVHNQNGTLEEAIRIWKSNIDKEFEGVEDCPICSLTFGEGSYQFPDAACNTCKHKFHSKCINKWLFSTYTYKNGWTHCPARKNRCPLCKSFFYPR